MYNDDSQTGETTQAFGFDDTLDLEQDQTLFDFSNEPELPQEESISKRYDLGEPLGQGAMGEVLLAVDKYLHRKVAYKQILPEVSRQMKLVQRFVTEAQITSQLEHPGVIPIYHMEYKGQWAYSMKRIGGQTLKEYLEDIRLKLKENPGDWPDYQYELLDIFLKICDTVAYAHHKGVIHRDLKPANVMIGTYGEVYILDWGLAKKVGNPESEAIKDHIVTSEDMEATQIGQVLGTPRYMSPEQAKGLNQDLTPASDQFALGLILYEICTLKPAIQGNDLASILEKIITGKFNRIDPTVHGYPLAEPLKQIISKAMSLSAQDRYQDVDHFRADLEAYLADKATSVYPDNAFRKLLRWARHHTLLTLVIFGALVFLALSAVGLSLYAQSQTLLKIQQTEIRLDTLFAVSSQMSQALDSQFLEQESLLRQLKSQVEVAALNGQPTELNTPSIMTESHPKYTVPVSMDAPLIMGEHQRLSPFSHLGATFSLYFKDPSLRWLFVHNNQPNLTLSFPGTQFEPPLNKNVLRDESPHWLPSSNFSPVEGSVFWGVQNWRSSGKNGVIGLAFDAKKLEAIFHDPLSIGQVYFVDAKLEPILNISPLETDTLNPLKTRLNERKSGYLVQDQQVWIYEKLNTMGWYIIFNAPLNPSEPSHHE